MADAERPLRKPVTTRRAHPGDAVGIAKAHVRAWQVAYEGIVPADFLARLDVEQRSQVWHQNLSEEFLSDGVTPAPTNYVAEVDDEVVGFACVGIWRDDPADNRAAELWALYVDPAQWGVGAGHALMVDTIAQFEVDGIASGYLWVLDQNAQARRFYERQGWSANDETKEDADTGVTIIERRYSINLD